MSSAMVSAPESASSGKLSRTTFTVALIGNPNTGKSTLFNALTGMKQHVGNYPGVTVEQKIGALQLDENTRIDLIDLPGTYSLAARSPDEMIAVDVLLGQQQGAQKIDAVLAIADASNPERNFYLISQLCELKLPVVIALNMMDVAESKGLKIDTDAISAALGTRVVAICANKGKNLDGLRAAIKAALQEKLPPTGVLPAFPAAMTGEIDSLMQELKGHAATLNREVNRLEAFRVLVDKGGYAEQRLEKLLGTGFCQTLESHRQKASRIPLPAEEVRVRYGWVKEVLAGAVARPAQPPPTRSDAIDKILTHWFTGTLIFAAMMMLVFQSIFTWSTPLMDLISSFFDGLGASVGASMADGPLKSMICDGVIAGVGGVLVFLPQICILFLFIALLEDCGYMSRAAFLMDRLLSHAGLSGKSFIPMLSSFACAVPGVMATRTIEDPRDRLTTILVAPLMSCSARLPVYSILIGAFIPEDTLGGWLSLRGLTLFAMYGVGLVVAVPVAWILKKTLLKGETPPFLIELPSYKVPDWRTVLLRVYDRGKAFTLRAGTIILAVSVVVWALSYFPHDAATAEPFNAAVAKVEASSETDEIKKGKIEEIEKAKDGTYLRQSYFGTMGHAVEPVFKPLGWDWRISMAAIASFPAREVIVATLGTIFNLGKDEDEESESLRDALKSATWEGSPKKLFNIPVALSVMVFFALCSQCAATLATIKRETNGWKWPIFSFTYMTLLAYFGALLTYQIGMWLGWGG